MIGLNQDRNGRAVAAFRELVSSRGYSPTLKTLFRAEAKAEHLPRGRTFWNQLGQKVPSGIQDLEIEACADGFSSDQEFDMQKVGVSPKERRILTEAIRRHTTPPPTEPDPASLEHCVIV